MAKEFKPKKGSEDSKGKKSVHKKVKLSGHKRDSKTGKNIRGSEIPPKRKKNTDSNK